AVAASDQPSEMPSCEWSQTKIAGVVRTATNVAARRNARHWSPSATCVSGEVRRGAERSAAFIEAAYPCLSRRAFGTSDSSDCSRLAFLNPLTHHHDHERLHN